MWRMLDKSASDLGNCSPIFLSCRSLASQCVCSSWEQGALDTHNSVMLSSFWPWGFQPWSKKELFQKNFARLPTPSFFLTNSTSTFIFTTISAFGGFFFFWLYYYAPFTASVVAALWIFPFPTLWSSKFVRGAEHFWRKLSEEGKRHSDMSKNRLGLLMYLVPCFQTAACWEPHPSVFSFFFHQEYVLSAIWFTQKAWNNQCWRENLMLFRSS